MQEFKAPAPLNLLNVSAAYAGDYSYFGFTSPMKGKRYRFELSPTASSLLSMTAVADYRHYLFFKPFTFAFRVLHIGRYLKDSEDGRFSFLYVGDPTPVRGYDSSSFGILSSDIENPEFKRLVGSRFGVANFELRVPFLGSKRLGLTNFKYLPADFILFFDSGVAWTEDDPVVWKISRTSTERIPVFSTGIAFRINIAGVFIL